MQIIIKEVASRITTKSQLIKVIFELSLNEKMATSKQNRNKDSENYFCRVFDIESFHLVGNISELE